MSKKVENKRRVKWAVLLSNNTDSRDNDCIEVFAHSQEEAREKTKSKIDFTRFSIRGVYKKSEL